MKAFGYALAVVLAVIIGIMYFDNKDSVETISTLEGVLQTQLDERNGLITEIDSLEGALTDLEVSESFLEAQVDSLGELIIKDSGKSCEHVLGLYKEQNKVLKASVEKCKEAKEIQRAEIRGYQDLVINYEVSCPTEIKLAVAKEHKEKKFLKWLERAGWVTLVVVILI